jgi:dienelactone hydrolase
LTLEGDLAKQMVEGIQSYLLKETSRLAAERERLWNRDFTSAERYEASIEPNRKHLREIIGAVDPRVAFESANLSMDIWMQTEVGRGHGFRVYAIRWPVFAAPTADADGMEAEGLLLQPDDRTVARAVAIPDADWTPEMLAGIADGVPDASQFARRLAENRVQVVIPLLMNRDDKFSGIPGIGMTNMPHREWIYRMAFEVGRHIIGFEVQKILAAVDWLERKNAREILPIGVMGYGEGGLLALYSASLDSRITATVVSGYFQSRESVWREPIYRDVWSLVRQFGDAELASMIAPRVVIVEACRGPEVDGPPPATSDRAACACPNGKLATPPLSEVQREVERARQFFKELNAEANLQFIAESGATGSTGSEPAIEAFLGALGAKKTRISAIGQAPRATIKFDPASRLHNQFNQMVAFTQALIRKSPDNRAEFWKNADASTLKAWQVSTERYRKYIWEEIIGRLPEPGLPPNPRSRMVLDEPSFMGYEVVLDVWPDVFAYGILLVPKGLRPGERRPVVVCQHGLEGRPTEVVDPHIDNHFYHDFGASLAKEGFVIFAPQNPYIGGDNFRIIQRIGHPIKLSLFSFILGQHQQILKWLSSQPFVDSDRIGFYGLSYGGKTAVRVPPLIDGYCLSICSGDFNEWVWKTTNVLTLQTYMLLGEYDMYEFNFANIINYSDLAKLMVPKPFMVERGHDDPVGVDQWVSYEYALVREFYDKLDIGDRTEIEFFNGPHEIHGVGTFKFLKKHLRPSLESS